MRNSAITVESKIGLRGVASILSPIPEVRPEQPDSRAAAYRQRFFRSGLGGDPPPITHPRGSATTSAIQGHGAYNQRFFRSGFGGEPPPITHPRGSATTSAIQGHGAYNQRFFRSGLGGYPPPITHPRGPTTTSTIQGHSMQSIFLSVGPRRGPSTHHPPPRPDQNKHNPRPQHAVNISFGRASAGTLHPSPTPEARPEQAQSKATACSQYFFRSGLGGYPPPYHPSPRPDQNKHNPRPRRMQSIFLSVGLRRGPSTLSPTPEARPQQAQSKATAHTVNVFSGRASAGTFHPSPTPEARLEQATFKVAAHTVKASS